MGRVPSPRQKRRTPYRSVHPLINPNIRKPFVVELPVRSANNLAAAGSRKRNANGFITGVPAAMA
jgi:hypothetical protein